MIRFHCTRWIYVQHERRVISIICLFCENWWTWAYGTLSGLSTVTTGSSRKGQHIVMTVSSFLMTEFWSLIIIKYQIGCVWEYTQVVAIPEVVISQCCHITKASDITSPLYEYTTYRRHIATCQRKQYTHCSWKKHKTRIRFKWVLTGTGSFVEHDRFCAT